MSHDGAIGIKTIRDDETKIILVDGASGDAATKKLSVVSEGDAFSNDVNDLGIPAIGKDASGNAIIIPVPLPITDNGGAITVDGTVGISGTVTVSGTVSVNEPVSIDDNGGSITVDASDLDIRDLTHVSDSVKVGDGTDFLAISGTGEASVEVTNAQGADGATAPSEALQIAGKDGAGNLQVLATDTSGKLNVNAAIAEPAAADKVCEFFSQASQAINTEKLFFYVVPNGKTFHGKFLDCGADGKILIKYGTSSDGLTLDGQKHQSWQQPKDTKQMAIPCLTLLGDGTKAICVAITPLDGGADDIYATLQGILV